MNILAPTTQAVTMSSREISDLVESRHDSVKRTIERLAKRGVIQLPPMVEVNNNQSDSPNARSNVYVFSGEKGKRDSIVVVAQLSPEFTARLVDRWQELENELAKPQAPQPAVSNIILITDALGRINLNMLQRSSGIDVDAKRPYQWVRSKQAQELIAELTPNLASGQEVVTMVRGGAIQGTFAHELLAVAYAGYISSEFQTQVTQALTDKQLRSKKSIEVNHSECNVAVSFNRSLPKGVYLQNSKVNPYRAMVWVNSKQISVGCYPTVEAAVDAQNRFFDTDNIEHTNNQPSKPLNFNFSRDGQYLVTVTNGKVSKYKIMDDKTLVNAESYWRLRKDLNVTRDMLTELLNRMRFIHEDKCITGFDYPINEIVLR
ncbi:MULTISPECIES: KilA-N domain-containing protein [Xenorhabdus]